MHQNRLRPEMYVVVLDFFAKGKHLVVDVVVTTVYRNTILQGAASIPGYVGKQAEDKNLYAHKTSTQPIAAIHGGPHGLVPFAMEDGCRLGAHARHGPPSVAHHRSSRQRQTAALCA